MQLTFNLYQTKKWCKSWNRDIKKQQRARGEKKITWEKQFKMRFPNLGPGGWERRKDFKNKFVPTQRLHLGENINLELFYKKCLKIKRRCWRSLFKFMALLLNKLNENNQWLNSVGILHGVSDTHHLIINKKISS